MSVDPTHPPADAARFYPRKLEMQALADILPLKGVDARSKRVVNVWGDREVGKSTFLSELREGEILSRVKILWIRPTRDAKIDTVAEFIGACSKTLRLPGSADSETPISQRLESVQQGRVNPLVSDDSILITRSSIATNKKPYINQAAAASVGRTETQREDIQVSVGLGESKATNQAEGFLDALPLQSLGTDLIILFIERLENLSITVKDWLKDYVIPAATRGPYRRNLIFVFESLDPLSLAYPNETWGEWDDLREDFHLPPLSEDDVYQHCLLAHAKPEEARYICRKSLGYPGKMQRCLDEARAGRYSGPSEEIARAALAGMAQPDRLKLGALCLPDILHPDELDAVFGPKAGLPALQWLAQLPRSPLASRPDGKGHTLPEPFRCAVLAAVSELPDFKPLRIRWAPLARLIHNAPDRSVRASLMVFAHLQWIDEEARQALFGSQAAKVMEFVVEHPEFFNRDHERYRVSERLRHDLDAVADAMAHAGAAAARSKAKTLWSQRRELIKAQVDALEADLARRMDEVNRLERRHAEASAMARITERKGGASYSESALAAAKKPSRGPLIAGLEILAGLLFASCFFVGNPLNFVALILGLAALSVGLALVPDWLAHRRAVAIARQAQITDSPENLRKRSLDITHDIQRREGKLDEVKQELAAAKSQLMFPYV